MHLLSLYAGTHREETSPLHYQTRPTTRCPSRGTIVPDPFNDQSSSTIGKREDGVNTLLAAETTRTPVFFQQSKRDGVKLAYVQRFIDECGGMHAIVGKTVEEVTKTFILPRTRCLSNSLCGQLGFEGQKKFIGRANWFVCMSHESDFSEVVESITQFFEKLCHDNREIDKDDIILWIDCFSTSMHLRPSDNDANSLSISEGHLRTTVDIIRETKNVLMILTSPWERALPCMRLKNIFEIFVCDQSKCRLEVTMTHKERLRFEETMQASAGDAFYNMMYTISNSPDSDLCDLNDPKMCLVNTFEQIIGCKGIWKQFDSTILQVMEEWILSQISKCLGNPKLSEMEIAKWELTMSSMLRKKNERGGRGGECMDLPGHAPRHQIYRNLSAQFGGGGCKYHYGSE